MPRIALVPGDGIGLEVVREARRVLEAVAEVGGPRPSISSNGTWGPIAILREGITITEEEFRSLAEEHDAILMGALGDPRVPGNEHARDILLGLRFRLDLYVNFRPCVLLAPELCPLKRVKVPVRLEIFRENTEGSTWAWAASSRRVRRRRWPSRRTSTRARASSASCEPPSSSRARRGVTG